MLRNGEKCPKSGETLKTSREEVLTFRPFLHFLTVLVSFDRSEQRGNPSKTSREREYPARNCYFHPKHEKRAESVVYACFTEVRPVYRGVSELYSPLIPDISEQN